MKFGNGISIAALLIAGAVATPSFATSLSPGGMVSPLPVVSGSGDIIASTGAIAFSFGSVPDAGTVQEVVSNNWSGNPFGAGDLSFFYQITVTSGNIVNLTSGSYAIPGLLLDVSQADETIPGFPTPTTAAVNASLTSNSTTLGFGFAQPNGLTPGDTSYVLIINTNMTNYQPGVFSLQDDETQNFNGFIPAATPEPGSLALLGTGLLGVAGVARRKFFRR